MPKTNEANEYSGNGAEERPADHAKRAEDRRIRRTKRLLRDAFLELITERGYEEVSVQDILERSDVGRTSFYTYFRSKEDLLLRSLEDLGSLLDVPAESPKKATGPSPGTQNGTKSESQSVSFSLSLFLHLGENRQLARALLGRGGIPVVREQVRIQLQNYYRNRLQPDRCPGLTEFEREGAALFAGGALLSLVLWWIEMDPPVAPKKMSELFEELLSGRSAFAPAS